MLNVQILISAHQHIMSFKVDQDAFLECELFRPVKWTSFSDVFGQTSENGNHGPLMGEKVKWAKIINPFMFLNLTRRLL